MHRIVFLTLFLLFVVTAGAGVERSASVLVGKAQPEALKEQIFPYNGGSGTITITVNPPAPHTIEKPDWVEILSATSTIDDHNAQTLVIKYRIGTATTPRKGNLEVSMTGYPLVVQAIRQAGKGAVSSSASFAAGRVASDGLATFWGENLTDLTDYADTLPLPRLLGGARIWDEVYGSDVRTALGLLFVFRSQVNFKFDPAQISALHIVYAENPFGELYSDYVNVGQVAPDTFGINSSDSVYDLAAVVIQDNTRGTIYENPEYYLDQDRKWQYKPLRMGAGRFLLFYLSGCRNDISLAASYALIDGTRKVPLLYAGPQGYYAGLDQIAIPADLSPGVHSVQFIINGTVSNTRRISCQ